ncbi:serine/arginine repetitive matrix protein 1-like [Ornithodoros turicata]|uniref:serine/arginine repetitive matrix protein 1-like n=1 Tax=Ornithodoros turicata TaxID=34597 RepID=UPI003139FCAE
MASTGRKSPRGESADGKAQQPPQSNFQRLWTKFLEKKKGTGRKEEPPLPAASPKKNIRSAPSSPSPTHKIAGSPKPNRSKTTSTSARPSPQSSPDPSTYRKPLRSTKTITYATTRNRLPPRTSRRSLPLPPDYSYRFVGPYSATYRNRFGTYSRISSSPPLRRRVVPPASPTRSRSGQVPSGRLSPVSPSRIRLYTLSCATASSAAKQRPPVRHYSPPRPPPSPPSPPSPPRKHALPTFASPTRSWEAKRAVSMPSVASIASRNEGRFRRQQAAKAKDSGKENSSVRRVLPQSPTASPVTAQKRAPVRTETFRTRITERGRNANNVQSKLTIARSKTFSKSDDRCEPSKREAIRSSSAERQRNMPSIKVTPPSPSVARKSGNQSTVRISTSGKTSPISKTSKTITVTKTSKTVTAEETKHEEESSGKDDLVLNGQPKPEEPTASTKPASTNIKEKSKSNGTLRRAASSSSVKTTEL